MSFTPSNLTAMENAMRQGMAGLMPEQDVDLYGAGTIRVSLRVGRRRTGDSDLTGGATQQSQLATIDAEDWDAKAGRAPQKGDVIHWNGRRYAIEDLQIVSPTGDGPFLYRCRLRG